MLDTREYRLAPSGEGPQAFNWNDKPHRLVYDLCAEIERLNNELDTHKVNTERWKTLLDGEGSYPKVLVHKGKHGNRYIFAADEVEEGQAWLVMFRSLDEWDGFYFDLDIDEEEAYAQAKKGSWRHAKWLLDVRSGYEYEKVDVEYLDTPKSMRKHLDG